MKDIKTKLKLLKKHQFKSKKWKSGVELQNYIRGNDLFKKKVNLIYENKSSTAKRVEKNS